MPAGNIRLIVGWLARLRHVFEYCILTNILSSEIFVLLYSISNLLNSPMAAFAVYKSYSDALLVRTLDRTLNSRDNRFMNFSKN